MKRISSLSFLVLILCTFTHGLQLVEKPRPAVLQARIERHTRPRDSLNSLLRLDNVRRDTLSRRQDGGTIDVALQNEVTTYIMTVNLGTPAQTLGLHLDTGSSDLWVNIPDSSLCTKYAQYCNELGTFNPSASSSFSVKNSLFKVHYEDGSGATGDYATDKISIGNTTIPRFEFGVARKSTTPAGIAGVGYRTNEGIARFGRHGLYPNLPASLAAQGVINTNAYSLWLNDLAASQGSILFGGVNTARFEGTLQTLPIIRVNGIYSQFLISLTAVGTGSDASAFVGAVEIPALLDSGTTLTYLPNAVAGRIYNQFGATYDSRTGIASVDCSLATNAATIDFTFSGVTIRVPLNELVINNAGGDVCAFGIAPSGSLTVLGDTFLRSAYVVYDLANNEISLAQTRFGSVFADHIVEITAGPDGVPDAAVVTGAATGISFTATARIPEGTDGFRGGSTGSAAGPGAVPAAMWALASVGAGLAVGCLVL